VEEHDVRGSGDVDAVGSRIDEQVVPAAVAAKGERLLQLVRRNGPGCCRHGDTREEEDRAHDGSLPEETTRKDPEGLCLRGTSFLQWNSPPGPRQGAAAPPRQPVTWTSFALSSAILDFIPNRSASRSG